MPDAVHRFAEALRDVLKERTCRGVEVRWDSQNLDALGWKALSRAWQLNAPRWERTLDEVDGLLLRLLDRLPFLGQGTSPQAAHIQTFRIPQLERLQHASAAALVSQRYGPAGLVTVVMNALAPVGRRYFAFLALAEHHPEREWPVFARYLIPGAHHAFVGTAAEAARFYPEQDAATALMRLFDEVRGDLHLREFLAPRILRSLYVLNDPTTLPFLRHLLVVGHTHRHPAHCEVTQALVIVRRLSGRIEASSKFSERIGAGCIEQVQRAEIALRRRSASFERVAVI